MNNENIKKGLAIVVITLFIGLAITPSINANIENSSNNNELVEVTTEVYGIDSVKHNVILLSNSDVTDLKEKFDLFEEQLKKVETKEEAIEIFNKAIIELKKHGLIGGLTVKQAQRLVTGGYYPPKLIKFFERILSSERSNLTDNNFFCLIWGRLGTGEFNDYQDVYLPGFIRRIIQNPLWLILDFIFWLGIYDIYYHPIISLLFIITFMPYLVYWEILGEHFPVHFSSLLFIGDELENYYVKGSILSIGLSGSKLWEGKLCGGLPFVRWVQPYVHGPIARPAAIGFTGFRWWYSSITESPEIIGFTPWVSINIYE